MTVQPLRPIAHPGQSDTLVHFTGRARLSYAPEVHFLTPEERLDGIVRDEALNAHKVPGSGTPVVCFSESDPDGIAAMLGRSGFVGWGVVLHRQWVWDQGGGPVWYARDDLWQRVQDSLDTDIRPWVVRTSPGDADWLHEREWRIPCPGGVLSLETEGLAAILVSDPGWEPQTRVDYVIDPGSGELVVGDVTPWFAVGVPLWWWDGTQLHELPPVGRREDPYPV